MYREIRLVSVAAREVSGMRIEKKNSVVQGKDVLVALEGTDDIQTEVLGLDLGEGGELDVAVRQVQLSDLLVEDLGQDVDAEGQLLSLGESGVLGTEGLVLGLVQHDLGKDLVAERAGHDEGGVSSGTAQVDETTLGQQDDVAAVGHQVAVYLRLDVLDALGVLLEPGDVDLNVEVANV